MLMDRALRAPGILPSLSGSVMVALSEAFDYLTRQVKGLAVA
jgi:hypothetical protein